jgi:hypothetical protein
VADDVMNTSTVDAPSAPSGSVPAAAPARLETRADRARRLAYRGRFSALYFVLAVVAGAGIGAFVVLVGRGSPAPAPSWSEWEPTGSAERRVAQISDHVARAYRLPTGEQLASAVSGPPSAPTADGTLVRMRAILVQPHTARGQAEENDIDVVDARNSMMFILCGIGGTGCAITQGGPTPERHALLRREALELALSTFKHVDGVSSVVVLLPPGSDRQIATAVFLERSDVSAELSRPLRDTLTAATTPGIGEIPVDERATIDRITRPRLYTYQYDSAQDGSPLMVLTPALSG